MSEQQGGTTPEQWDALWQVIYESYYDSYYQELEAELLLRRWERFDEIVKVLVALTASSSAVAGWALWDQPSLRYFWVSLAGLSAVLSIIHAAMSVSSRLREWGEIKQIFCGLRIDLETLQLKMKLSSSVKGSQISEEFLVLRKRFGEGIQMLRNDALRTDHLRKKAQSLLNQKLGVE